MEPSSALLPLPIGPLDSLDPNGVDVAAEPLIGARSVTERELVILGRPQTAKRARFKRNGPTYPDRATEERKGDVAALWADRHGTDVAYGRRIPLAVELDFVFVRPDGHFGTGRNAGIVKASAPVRPGAGAGGGDLDNLAKLILDALNGVAFHDDSQIAELRLSKRYAVGAEPAHTALRIFAL